MLTTVKRREDAQKMATMLIEHRVAGCVQIVGPVISVYRWKNEVETEKEWLCIIKSSRALYDDLERAIKKVHRYETPEILAVPIVAGSENYFEWLANELTNRE